MVVLVVRYRVQRASAQRTATETQRAAQLFARDVREFELFMRAVYALPCTISVASRSTSVSESGASRAQLPTHRPKTLLPRTMRSAAD